MTAPTKEQIIHRAYELWERAEKPEGRDEEFYHQAEKELNEGITGEEKSETFLMTLLARKCGVTPQNLECPYNEECQARAQRHSSAG